MPRPRLKSDDEVLDAANTVLKRCGPVNFTLNEVAAEVGLSRAALIQRFVNRDTLLIKMMARSVAQARAYLERLPMEAGPEGLWAFLQALVRGMGGGYDFSVNFLIAWYELQVPELRKLAVQRNRAVLDAIARRLPPGTQPNRATLLHAVIAGAATQWVTQPRGSLADHVLAQVAEALRLMFPDHASFDVHPARRGPGARPAKVSRSRHTGTTR